MIEEWLMGGLLIWGGWGGEMHWRWLVGLTVGLAWVVWLAKEGKLCIKRKVKMGMIVGGGVVVSGLWTGMGREWGWWIVQWLSGVMVGVISGSVGKKIDWAKVGVRVGVILAIIAWLGGGEHGFSLVQGLGKYHHHLGDWWVVVGWGLVEEKRGWQLLGGGVGVVWLVKSMSRSAYGSLLVGLGWWKNKIDKKVLIGGIVLLMGLVGWVGSKKAFFGNRVYWWQAIEGIKDRPWGWGWGSFVQVGEQYNQDESCEGCLSITAHDVILEVAVSGGVILGLMMMWWWGQVLLNLGEGVTETMLVTLMVNMLTDYTYLIPAMWWLFWGLLGRIGEE